MARTGSRDTYTLECLASPQANNQAKERHMTEFIQPRASSASKYSNNNTVARWASREDDGQKHKERRPILPPALYVRKHEKLVSYRRVISKHKKHTSWHTTCSGMASLEKLAIRGIRSFSPEEEQVRFDRPQADPLAEVVTRDLTFDSFCCRPSRSIPR